MSLYPTIVKNICGREGYTVANRSLQKKVCHKSMRCLEQNTLPFEIHSLLGVIWDFHKSGNESKKVANLYRK